ncbi:MAG: uracil-DNA glycosylase superfamily [Devosia sp.]|uniref:G/U mismatch-specific DNA glycosylase n=1 Tax=Devosia sp. TaxID=1871048 RepID=UPI00262D1940|nr:G/U mismatch-specific DNA glycosylase [Devosia sp.]MDB5585041.1 uracil-DNA glycosylase superfamily [Devosia sp.]
MSQLTDDLPEGAATISGLADILAPRLSIVFCGINPAATAAISGKHFSSPSNRFWRTLHLAGFTPTQITPEQGDSVLDYGYGLTTAVARPARQASDLTRLELVQSAGVLQAKIETYRPVVLAFLGKAAYGAISGKKDMPWGRQDHRFGGAIVWVLPNPSGLNRAFPLVRLVSAYRELRDALDAGETGRAFD